MQRFKKILSTAVTVTTISWSIGLGSLVPLLPVHAAPTNISIIDQDGTGFGIDGRDFAISFDVGTLPAGFTGAKVYIIPSVNVTGIAADTVETGDCNGGEAGAFNCTPRGFFNQLPQNNNFALILPEAEKNDSINTPFSAQAYKVCVLYKATTPEFACSTMTLTPTSDAPTDTERPFINHMPVHTAFSGSTAYFYALIFDNQTQDAAFAARAPALVDLKYGTDLDTVENTAQGARIGAEGSRLFEFQIPSGNLTEGQTLEYYIMATDSSDNSGFVCNALLATSANACKAAPLTLTVAASPATPRRISGTVKQPSGTTVSGANVLTGGYAVQTQLSAVGGVFNVANNNSLTPFPSNSTVEIRAYAPGYCSGEPIVQTVPAGDLTDTILTLLLGDCNQSGGGAAPGGTGGAPHPVFSGPPEAGTMPPSDNIRVGFDQQLNAQTVNDDAATDATDNIYLIENSAPNTKLGGAVTYCADNNASGCSTLFAQDQNTILFNPTTDLTAGSYTLVINSAVTSTTGQTIQGNRTGGGHEVHFTVTGAAFNTTQIQTSFGTGGTFNPPFVESVQPAPGASVAPNANVLVVFNDSMDTTTITATNIQLIQLSNNQAVTTAVSVDNTTKRVVTIDPAADLATGEYSVKVLGSVKNTFGVPIAPPDQSTRVNFQSNFQVSGSADATAPTIFSMVADGATGVPTNQGTLEFGFNEPMNPSTLTASTVTMSRGPTAVAVTLSYDAGKNSLFVSPNTSLLPNTRYTVNFGSGATGVKDLSGIALASNQTFFFTTGTAADTAQPEVGGVRCDEISCGVIFSEAMNNDSAAAAGYAASVLNPNNYLLDGGALPGTATLTYDPVQKAVKIKGITGTTGADFTLTVQAAAKDLAGNLINTTGGINAFQAKFEDSKLTFGSFTENAGMFAPPTTSGGTGTVGNVFKPEGFGAFTAEQMAFGQGDSAHPFNKTAGQDVNVFQVRFVPTVALEDGDQIDITFPNGTTVTDASADTFSPFFKDMNEFAAGTIDFDETYSTDGVAGNAATRTVTVQLDVAGTPSANDPVTIDLRTITNPSIPKGPDSGGYTVTIKVKRAGRVLATKTSTPYFIQQGGSRTITLNVCTQNDCSVDAGKTGNVFVFGGGPSGPMDAQITVTNGAGAKIYSNLNDGCYFIGSEPFVTLGGTEYFGADRPDQICVSDANQTPTKDIILSPAAAAGASVEVTVKFSGVANLGGDADIFAGGPGRFVVKTVAQGALDANGYTIRLPASGNWFVGVGPAMSKTKSAGSKVNTGKLTAQPPPPMELVVDVAAGTAVAGSFVPPGVTYVAATRTITFAAVTADKNITGTVQDGNGNGLQNVEMIVHARGFGAPVVALTDNTGAFTLSVAQFGAYEIGARFGGLPPFFEGIEVQPDGADAGTDADIFFRGKQVTGGNPLVIKLQKTSAMVTISGKVLDASGDAIAGAPVFASISNNTQPPLFTNTDSTGAYTFFVTANTSWTLRSELPPDKTDGCGTFSKSVTVTTDNASNQNIQPSTSTCVELTGTITVNGAALASVPIMVEQWDTTNSVPATNGFFRPTSTNSSGVYTVKVIPDLSYRVGLFDPVRGELTTIKAVAGANATADITTTTGTVTFAFTGGAAAMNAFIELRKTDGTRRIKQLQGLNTNHAVTVPASGTYSYFVDVFGVGKFTGTVAAGATATVDLSSSSLVTISGAVKDANGTAVNGAVVKVKTSDNITVTAVTDTSGNYSLDVKPGSVQISTARAGYVAPQVATASFTTNTTNYDFGGDAPDQAAPEKASQVVSGTVKQSDGTTNTASGYVEVKNTATNQITTTSIAADGTFSAPVIAGTYEVKAVSDGHTKTTLGTTTVTAADVTVNGTLTADATKTAVGSSKSLAANVGGNFDDSATTGTKVNVGSGVLEGGSGNVTVAVEKSFTAPETSTQKPLGDAEFDITATGTSLITNLNGNAEITLDYASLVSQLPSGVSEGDLQLAYFSSDKNEYIPVEGGFTVDATNNTITGQVNHFTTFAIVFAPPAVAAASSGDDTPPAAPTNVKATSSGKSVVLTWTDPTDTDLSRIIVLRNRRDATETVDAISGNPKDYVYVDKGKGTYTDTNVTAGTTYKYILRSEDTSGNVKLNLAEVSATVAAATTPVGTTTPTTPTTTTPTTTPTTPTTTTTPATPATPAAPATPAVTTSTARTKVISSAKAFKVTLTSTDEGTLADFVTNGTTHVTVKLGSGERLAVVRDILETLGRVSVRAIEQISAGEKPVDRNLGKEQTNVRLALPLFQKILGVKRAPNFQNANEDLAWNTLMYRIRFARDLAKERKGIARFVKVIGRNPSSPLDWAAVRAYGYKLAK